MFKLVATRDAQPDRRVFSIHENGEPASAEMLERIVLVASRLLQENDLPGRFRADRAAGTIELDLPETDRSYFHDGILFAALDVFNDPSKNPTLFRFSLDGR